MDNTVYITMSKQAVLRRQLDIVANNLANMETTAYKAESPLFSQHLQRATDQRNLSYVQDTGLNRDISEGEFIETGGPLDVAIHGDGFFVAETDGGFRYTRNGHFSLNADGQLVTTANHLVMDIDNNPIEFAAGDTDITISPDGTITSAQGDIGRLRVVSFEDQRQLRREANSMLVSDVDPIEPRDVSLAQGMLEQSNVQPIMEMVSMIQLHREYQSNSKLIERDEDIQRKMIERIMSP